MGKHGFCSFHGVLSIAKAYIWLNSINSMANLWKLSLNRSENPFNWLIAINNFTSWVQILFDSLISITICVKCHKSILLQKHKCTSANEAQCLVSVINKAFDTLDHDILLYKLHYYDVRGNALLLLKSYLENRQQFVEYDNT